MKINYGMALGGLAGLIVPLAAVAAFFLLDETQAPAATSPETETVESAIPDPVPAPSSPALTNTQPLATRGEAPPTPARPAVERPEASGPVQVRRLIITRAVEGHEPVDAADTFVRAPGERLYAFIDAANDGDETSTLHVTFEPTDGETTGHVSLDVPANVGRYRTWAYTRNAERAGRWDAVVRAADGRELARRSFEITE